MIRSRRPHQDTTSRRPSWGAVAGTAALVISLTNVALGQAGSVGAGEAASNPPVMSTKKDCEKLVKQGKDCAYLTNDSVKGPNIAPNAVGMSEIAAKAIGSSEIAPNSVQSAMVAASAITSGKLAPDSVISSKVKPGSIEASDVGKLGIENINGVMPKFRGEISFTDQAVVNPQFIGSPPEGTTLQNGRRAFDTTRQVGGDFTCVRTPPSGNNVLPCVEAPVSGVYMLSMDVTWAANNDGTRIAAVMLPGPDELSLPSTTWTESASGGGGVLASSLPTSSDNKQTQSFSRLVELEAGQVLILVLDYFDPFNPGRTLDVTAKLSLALQ